MRVQPSRPGLLVGYPGRASYLAAGGEEVARDSYWLRRLMKGDVIEVALETSAPAPPPPAESATTPTTSKRKRARHRSTDENPES